MVKIIVGRGGRAKGGSFFLKKGGGDNVQQYAMP